MGTAQGRDKVRCEASNLVGQAVVMVGKVASVSIRPEGKPTVRTIRLLTLGAAAAVEPITALLLGAQEEALFVWWFKAR